MKLNDSNDGGESNDLVLTIVGIGAGMGILLGGAAIAGALDGIVSDPSVFGSEPGESSWNDHVHDQISQGLEV